MKWESIVLWCLFLAVIGFIGFLTLLVFSIYNYQGSVVDRGLIIVFSLYTIFNLSYVIYFIKELIKIKCEEQ